MRPGEPQLQIALDRSTGHRHAGRPTAVIPPEDSGAQQRRIARPPRSRLASPAISIRQRSGLHALSGRQVARSPCYGRLYDSGSPAGIASSAWRARRHRAAAETHGEPCSCVLELRLEQQRPPRSNRRPAACGCCVAELFHARPEARRGGDLFRWEPNHQTGGNRASVVVIM